MTKLEKYLNPDLIGELKREAFNRAVAEGVFTEWRDTYVTNLLGYIRLYAAAQRRGVKLPPPYRSASWCNAAVLLLTAAPVDVQDHFLWAKIVERDGIVDCVLADGGVVDINGFFVELPVL